MFTNVKAIANDTSHLIREMISDFAKLRQTKAEILPLRTTQIQERKKMFILKVCFFRGAIVFTGHFQRSL